MELYFFTRGIKDCVDKTIVDLQAQTFPRVYKGQNMMSWGHLNPIQFWSYGFPHTELQTVLRTIEPSLNYYNPLNKYGLILRKMLGAKKIPPIEPKGPKKYIRKKHVQIWGIGIREDKFDDRGEELL